MILKYKQFFERIEFKENLLNVLQNETDKISEFLKNYALTNDDNYFTWIDLTDSFTSDRFALTFKNNRIQSMKLTKFLRKILPLHIKDDEIDAYVSKLVFKKLDDTYFEVWESDKIKQAFLSSNFLIKSGELSNSCMSHEYCQDFFDIYCKNKNVKMLVLLKDGKIVARALLWNAFYENVNKIVMDNVYALNDNEKNKMFNYAKKMNYVYFDGKYFRDENSTYFKEFKVYLENVIFEKYPYIDNIRNLNKNEKTLSTLQTEETYTLHHKDGTIPTCTTCQGDKELICPDCDGTGVDEYGDDCDTCDFKSTGIAYIDCPKCSKRI